MRDDLGIAMSAEMVAAAFELLPHLRIVEKLPVEDHGHGAIFVVNGLPAILQTDYAQAAIGQAERAVLQVTILVGPAMENGISHALQNSRWHRLRATQIDHARDTTHTPFLLVHVQQRSDMAASPQRLRYANEAARVGKALGRPA